MPHVLVGDLALGSRGDRVAYLVHPEDVFQGEIMVSFRPGVPIRVGQVPIVYLVPEGPEIVQESMRACLDLAAQFPGEGVVAPLELVVYVQLWTKPIKGAASVVALLRSGLNPDGIQAFLHEAGDVDILRRFMGCLLATQEEPLEPYDFGGLNPDDLGSPILRLPDGTYVVSAPKTEGPSPDSSPSSATKH